MTTTTFQTHVTRHTTVVSAPAETVFDLIADVTRWPQMFHPTVHVDLFGRDGDEERMRIWAFANGQVRTWISRRLLDRAARRVAFRQERPPERVASMGGQWLMRPLDDGTVEVVLDHDFSAIDDDPTAVELIGLAVDKNSTTELTSLKDFAERREELHEVSVTFSDSIVIPGSLVDVYDFLYRAEEWPQRLPHVSRLELTEPEPGIQILEMDTRDPDGSVHTTSSVRLGLAPDRIVYKQVSLPPFLVVHTGAWLLRERVGGVEATAEHSVVFCRDAIGELLGPEATVEDARNALRHALGANSRTTLAAAKAFIGGGTCG